MYLGQRVGKLADTTSIPRFVHPADRLWGLRAEGCKRYKLHPKDGYPRPLRHVVARSAEEAIAFFLTIAPEGTPASAVVCTELAD